MIRTRTLGDTTSTFARAAAGVDPCRPLDRCSSTAGAEVAEMSKNAAAAPIDAAVAVDRCDFIIAPSHTIVRFE